MILSDKCIEREQLSGNLVIEPFDRRNLGSDTYDVRLGEWYYRENDFCYFNPFSRKSVERVWGEPIQADNPHIRIEGWKADDRVIVLFPGETILAHTQEFIGGVRGITTKMFARSSVGRAGIGVCKCAGRGDVGFFNRWTMEITSFSKNRIPLKVGMRIAQIEFLRVGKTEQVYGRDRGKYQHGSELQAIMRDWKPEMMLPRLYDDWEMRL